MSKVAAVGELLIDWVPVARGAEGYWLYECHPGGAPANLLSCLAQFGHEVYMIARVGKDAMGEEICAALDKGGVSRAYVTRDESHPTTLALVGLTSQGERSFTFYREGCADLRLSREMIPKELISRLDMLCVGSLSMVGELSRQATLFALETARKAGVRIAYDPNDRPLLWPGRQTARQAMLEVLSQADVVKLSKEELTFLSGRQAVDKGAQQLLEDYGLQVLFVTFGARGSRYYTRSGLNGSFGPAGTDGIVDTTGAGDFFFGGVLSALLEAGKPLENLGAQAMADACRRGNACGYAVSACKGALGIDVRERVRLLLAQPAGARPLKPVTDITEKL